MAITCVQFTILKSLEINGFISKILLAKLFLFGILFLFYRDVRWNQKLTFYKNFGISKLGLFSISFLMDAFHTILTISLLKLF